MCPICAPTETRILPSECHSTVESPRASAADPRAVLFARLTLSTNLLFQMLGRGLRGLKVGGTESGILIDPIRLLSRFDVAQGVPSSYRAVQGRGA